MVAIYRGNSYKVAERCERGHLTGARLVWRGIPYMQVRNYV